MDMQVHTLCNRFFLLLGASGPLGLIIVWHNFQKKSSNAAMPRSGKNTANDTII